MNDSSGSAGSDRQHECVQWFAAHMEKKLRENDHKPGWFRDSHFALLRRLREEVEELAEATMAQDSSDQIVKEAADVANFAMMIADNARRNAASAP